MQSHAQKGLLRYQREIHVSLCIIMKCWAMAWGAGTTYSLIHDKDTFNYKESKKPNCQPTFVYCNSVIKWLTLQCVKCDTLQYCLSLSWLSAQCRCDLVMWPCEGICLRMPGPVSESRCGPVWSAPVCPGLTFYRAFPVLDLGVSWITGHDFTD